MEKDLKNNQSSKKSLALSKLNCHIDDFDFEGLELTSLNGRGELYKKFVEKFFIYLPVDYRSKNKIQLFAEFTNEAFEFCLNRPEKKRKIEIHRRKFQNSPSLTILVSVENKPFIIDSLNSLMLNLGLQIVFTFHPVIAAVRDKDGVLQDIDPTAKDAVHESLVYIKVLGDFDDQEIEKLYQEICKITDLVDYTYNSWQLMLNKLIDITTHIVHDKDIYESKNLPAEETLDFLNWLQKNNITFLGAVNFDVKSRKILSSEGVEEIWKDNIEELSTIIEFSESDYYKNKLAILGKINKISPVHRNALVDYILIKKLDEKGNYVSGSIIFGLYGTAIYFQSIKNIPILREKMNYVIDRSGFPVNGYNAKKIKNIVESLPRDTLIQIDEDDLYCMCIHMLSSMRSHKLKLFIQKNWFNSFVNVIIFMPRERLTPEVYKEISSYLTNKFDSEIIFDNITVVANNFSHLFTTLAVKDQAKIEFDHKEMEKDLIQITTNWSDSLQQKLCDDLGEYDGSVRYRQIEASFPAEYRYKFSAETTIDDMHYLEKASKQNSVSSNLIQGENGEYFLKFYSPEKSLTLSETLPAIENLGFIAVDEQSFLITKSNDFKQSWIYEFKLSSPEKIEAPFAQLKKNIESALYKMSLGEFRSDILCKMIVLSGLAWRDVKLLRAITRYLHQTGFPYGKDYVQETLIKHHKYTDKIVAYFKAKHHPEKASKEKEEALVEEMKNYLDSVDSSIEDKVLQSIYGVVKAMLRTNFYQKKNGEYKKYFSFKFDSTKVPDLPLPHPHAEIFVCSNKFEGVHLRGGKVARGGLRWSDRGEDYRTEVLGLMKSQMTKNTVIVPVGSKGGFYVHLAQGDLSRDEYMSHVVGCYKDFLRGLLDLTDNLIDGKVVQPKDMVIYDEEDPYLVVAADKGTATFSDFANEVSNEYNFWLADAFASGGSVGYDHKKMGITAKGAWISAQLHFLGKGIDIQEEPFRVVGIGDMSGDVFGNGMLLSKKIKLVAAFNHQHIFIDPDPDCAKSYEERQRLFTTPRTKWSDYNEKLISKGGGIFDRSAKMIRISPEIKNLLDITVDTISPDNLIKAILKSDVDLMWNGGIGTYIKASHENNVDIGDKANDPLRVDGCDVRAKVIAEGGNLGLSQLGRIEYALNGGVINTDFIDNSAGVDCSDHEVNIKIALNSAVLNKKISMEERNDLLEKMTQDVEELVLIDNYDQNLALTLLSLSPTLNIESFTQLTRELERSNLLDSEVEFLPSNSELTRRTMSKEGMTRPELSILLSYSKMALDMDLSEATFANDKYFEKHLYNYFPNMMQEKFADEIVNHPLKNDIIRTIITNKLINQIGGPVVSLIKKETGANACDIVRAHAVVLEVFELEKLWKQVAELDCSINIKVRIEMLSDLVRIMRRGITWFVRNISSPINITELINVFRKQTAELTEIISKLLVGTTKTRFFSQIEHFTSHGISNDLAQAVTTLEVLVSAFDIIFISRQEQINKEDIANLYFECGDALNIDWLRQTCEAQIDQSFWNRLSVQSLKDDFYDKQRRIIRVVLASGSGGQIPDFKTWLSQNESHINIFTSFVEDIKLHETLNLNMMILANKKLEIFLRKLEVG